MADASPQPRPLARPPHRRPLRSAFSLVELLVVIGILILLVSLSVIGFRVVGGVMRERSTTVALENCQGLVTAFKLTNAADSMISNGIIVYVCGQATTGGVASYTDPVRWTPPGNGVLAADWTVLNCAAPVPAVKAADGTFVATPQQQAINARYLQDETARVLKRLAQVPANASAIAAMSGNQVRVRFPRDPSTVLSSAASPPEYTNVSDDTKFIDGINLLDGYGHPIVFVPGGGLINVSVGYTGKGDKTNFANYDQQRLRLRAVDRQPFWASGGVDGDLTTGDDNVYSTATELAPN